MWVINNVTKYDHVMRIYIFNYYQNSPNFVWHCGNSHANGEKTLSE